jgi:two-component system chemotaxis response regulator CheY
MLAIVIDDSRVVRMILRKSLVSHGFHVIEASNGQEGLDALVSQGSVDLILVDWNMPIMDGISFVSTVRSDHSWDNTRILMVTSEADISRVTQALEAGADEYLMKPFDEDALREKLQILGVGRASVA